MERAAVERLLRAVQGGKVSVARAMARLAPAGGAEPDLGFAVPDHGRAERCGFPEVVYCPGKEPADAAAIATEIARRSGRLLMTRATEAVFAAVRGALPQARFEARARCITWRARPVRPTGLVAILAAGTADLPVAEEARVTAEMMAARVETHYDVGVAGLHRVLGRVPSIRKARALVVVAGMEGALASVVGGLVDRPVIGVPTSVGYGASFAGIAPLLTMLNACAAGVAVVNIDNGFGAGYLAAVINRAGPAPRR
jgi:NCAIR mutase (PurE)-related protein